MVLLNYRKHNTLLLLHYLSLKRLRLTVVKLVYEAPLLIVIEPDGAAESGADSGKAPRVV